MKTLTIFKDDNRVFQMMQSAWAAILNPYIRTPILNGVTVEDVALINGVTVVNHRLGRKPQGWVLTDVDSVATVYRSAPFNELTLTLTSNAVATAQLWVF